MAGPYEFTVRVKYVRREIRSLTDQDREMFFNAVAVMQRVPSGIGQLVYGSRYYSKDYLTRLHLYYGNNRELFVAGFVLFRFSLIYFGGGAGGMEGCLMKCFEEVLIAMVKCMEHVRCCRNAQCDHPVPVSACKLVSILLGKELTNFFSSPWCVCALDVCMCVCLCLCSCLLSCVSVSVFF